MAETQSDAFTERLEQYRSMPGDTAWDQIADDWRAGKVSLEDARTYADILFPPIIEPHEPDADETDPIPL